MDMWMNPAFSPFGSRNPGPSGYKPCRKCRRAIPSSDVQYYLYGICSSCTQEEDENPPPGYRTAPAAAFSGSSRSHGYSAAYEPGLPSRSTSQNQKVPASGSPGDQNMLSKRRKSDGLFVPLETKNIRTPREIAMSRYNIGTSMPMGNQTPDAGSFSLDRSAPGKLHGKENWPASPTTFAPPVIDLTTESPKQRSDDSRLVVPKLNDSSTKATCQDPIFRRGGRAVNPSLNHALGSRCTDSRVESRKSLNEQVIKVKEPKREIDALTERAAKLEMEKDVLRKAKEELGRRISMLEKDETKHQKEIADLKEKCVDLKNDKRELLKNSRALEKDRADIRRRSELLEYEKLDLEKKNRALADKMARMDIQSNKKETIIKRQQVNKSEHAKARRELNAARAVQRVDTKSDAVTVDTDIVLDGNALSPNRKSSNRMPYEDYEFTDSQPFELGDRDYTVPLKDEPPKGPEPRLTRKQKFGRHIDPCRPKNIFLHHETNRIRKPVVGIASRTIIEAPDSNYSTCCEKKYPEEMTFEQFLGIQTDMIPKMKDKVFGYRECKINPRTQLIDRTAQHYKISQG